MTAAALGFPRTAIGRADLIRAWAAGGEVGLAAMARRLGYAERTPEPTRPEAASVTGQNRAAEVAPSGRFAPIPFWVLEEIDHVEPLPAPPPPPPGEPIGIEGLGRLEGTRPKTPPLVPDARLWPALRGRLASAVPSREVDVEALAAVWSRGLPALEIPFRPLAAWAHRVTLLIDRSVRLIQFWDDQDRVVQRLQRHLGRTSVARVLYHEGAPWPWRSAGGHRRMPPARPDVPVLALSDLGSLAAVVESSRWRTVSLHLRRTGARHAALVPCPANRWPRETVLWDALEWERPRTAPRRGAPLDEDRRRARAERLLALLSFASRIEPGLLRAVRHLLPADQADAGTEADAWSHPEVLAGFASAARLTPRLRKRLQPRFAAEPEALQRRVVALLRAWRAGAPREIWLDEVLGMAAGANLPPGTLLAGEIEAAYEHYPRLVETLERAPIPPAVRRGLSRFVERSQDRLPEAAWADPSLGSLLWKARRAAWSGEGEPELPAGVNPAVLGPGGAVRRWQVCQVGRELRFVPSGARIEVGSPLVEVESANARVALLAEGELSAAHRPVDAPDSLALPSSPSVRLLTDGTAATLRRMERPAWASAMGRDRYGLWASFEVEGVAQRMRWIPPGRFFMGSPEDEPGRWDDEGPRHLETIPSGYWLADTPCTQSLWQAVTGSNPSRFQTPDRPVEQVSFEDCVEFLAELNRRVEGLEARLPQEVEWEYACRAGTETATYAGPIEILGERDAPALHAISWYGGNSGEDYELEEAEDSSGWPEKQLDHRRAGSRPVGRKLPNPWGLQDMLGNVFEWCDDVWTASYDDPPKGSSRVFRGGSWLSLARGVRAAFRFRHASSRRWSTLGFRLARGQGALQPATEQGGAEPRGAERPRGAAGRGTRRPRRAADFEGGSG